VPALQEDWISSLVDESGRELLRFLARRLGNETEAEDLAQEVYLRLLRVDDVSHVRNRRAYVLRVAANVAHEWRMLARNRRVHSSENIEEQVSTSHGPQELATQEQDMRCLMRALSTLSPVCRSVVLLLKRDGLARAGRRSRRLFRPDGSQASGAGADGVPGSSLESAWRRGSGMIVAQDKTTSSIRAAAAHWVVRMSTSELSAVGESEFFDWIRRSPEHVVEYLRAEAGWQEMDGAAKQDASDVAALLRAAPRNVWPLEGVRAEPGGGSPRTPDITLETTPTAHRRRAAVGVAAGVLLVLALACVAWLFERSRGHTLSTGVGEQRRVVLADGSVVELNAVSRVRVKMTGQARTVYLDEGEGFFEVAKEGRRPFRVISDAAVVRAVGTQFNVYRSRRGTSVTVVEGRVAVDPVRRRGAPDGRPTGQDATADMTEALGLAAGASSDPVASGSAAEPIELAAGQQVLIATDRGEPRAGKPVSVNPAISTSWRQRRLIFDDRSLADVVLEFNRYNRRQLVIEDPALGAERVNGIFDSDKPQALVRFLQQQSHVRATEVEGSDVTLLSFQE
jgi:transmembrane sensor